MALSISWLFEDMDSAGDNNCQVGNNKNHFQNVKLKRSSKEVGTPTRPSQLILEDFKPGQTDVDENLSVEQNSHLSLPTIVHKDSKIKLRPNNDSNKVREQGQGQENNYLQLIDGVIGVDEEAELEVSHYLQLEAGSNTPEPNDDVSLKDLFQLDTEDKQCPHCLGQQQQPTSDNNQQPPVTTERQVAGSDASVQLPATDSDTVAYEELRDIGVYSEMTTVSSSRGKNKPKSNQKKRRIGYSRLFGKKIMKAIGTGLCLVAVVACINLAVYTFNTRRTRGAGDNLYTPFASDDNSFSSTSLPLKVQLADMEVVVEESATDSHAVFVHEFIIQDFAQRNWSIGEEASEIFTTNDSLAKIRLDVYPDGVDKMSEGNVSACLRLLTPETQCILNIRVALSIKTPNNSRFAAEIRYCQDFCLKTEKCSFASLASRQELLDEHVNALTLHVQGSYPIRRQRTVAMMTQDDLTIPSPSSVSISFTWKLCNFTHLNLTEEDALASAVYPQSAKLAQFYVTMFPGTRSEGFVSVYVHLRALPQGMALPLSVNHSFALIDSSAANGGQVVEEHSLSSSFVEVEGYGKGGPFRFDAVVNAMRNECAIFKFLTIY